MVEENCTTETLLTSVFYDHGTWLDIILGEQQQNLSLCNDIWYTDLVFLKTDFCDHLCYASFGHRIGEKKEDTWKVMHNYSISI